MICHFEARSSGLSVDLRRLKLIAVLALAGLTLSGCLSSRPKLDTTSSLPPQQELGPARVEPLFYSGRTYQVQFRQIKTRQAYLVDVSARGAVLGKTSEDRRVVSEVGRNAINHFVCLDGQTAQIVDGSVQPGVVGWKMMARCV